MEHVKIHNHQRMRQEGFVDAESFLSEYVSKNKNLDSGYFFFLSGIIRKMTFIKVIHMQSI